MNACKQFKNLDKRYNTNANSPLHHDNRCRDCANMLHLRKLATDQTLLCELPSGDVVRVNAHKNDVVATRKPGGPVVAIWCWYQHNKPTRRNRYVMFDCARWPVQWEPQA